LNGLHDWLLARSGGLNPADRNLLFASLQHAPRPERRAFKKSLIDQLIAVLARLVLVNRQGTLS
jgi:hypothetical protein